MKLTNTSQYALRILCYMAKDEKQLYSAKFLIEELKISDKYLRRIMTSLVKADFIISVMGRDGGYMFNKNPDELFIADVVNCFEGMQTYLNCVLGFHQCDAENPCVMHNVWDPVRKELQHVFSTHSIRDLDINLVKKF